MRACAREYQKRPFSDFPRDKQWHAAENRAAAKRGNDFSGILKWHYGPRTKEEVLFFGGTTNPHGFCGELIFKEFPFLEKIKKENSFKGDKVATHPVDTKLYFYDK